MTNADDAKEHLTVVHNFMDGKKERETRRITRDLSARLNPIMFTSALAATLPHVAKDEDAPTHFVGIVFTQANVLTVASTGSTMIVCKIPARDGARVTGDVVADSVTVSPVMAKQLMGFAGLTPKEAWDPELELTVTGTGPDKVTIRATDRTGLFEGKSLRLPVSEPGTDLARAVHVLESMAAQAPRSVRTTSVPAGMLKTFIASAEKFGGDVEVEAISDTLWRISSGTAFYGLAARPVEAAETDEKKLATNDARRKDRDQWSLDLTGLGQELVRGLQ